MITVGHFSSIIPNGIQAVKDETQQLNIGLLVNNAGREDSGHFLRTSIEEALSTVDLNCRVPLQLTHHFAQKMAKREKGGIIFMSSVVSFQGVPHIANYAASKAYDLIFAEGVAAELKPYNVDVTAVAPGFAKTELSPAFNFDGLPIKPMAPELVARKGISSLGRKRLTIPGAINKFLYLSGKYLQPRRMNTLPSVWFSNEFSAIYSRDEQVFRILIPVQKVQQCHEPAGDYALLHHRGLWPALSLNGLEGTISWFI